MMECLNLKLEVDCIDDPLCSLDQTVNVKFEDEKEWTDPSLEDTVQPRNAGYNVKNEDNMHTTCGTSFNPDDIITIAPMEHLLVKDVTFTEGNTSTYARCKADTSCEPFSACNTDVHHLETKIDTLEAGEEIPAAPMADQSSPCPSSSPPRCSVGTALVIQPYATSSNPEFHTRKNSTAHTSEQYDKTYTESSDTHDTEALSMTCSAEKALHCSRGFTQSTSLKKHTLTRSSEKPYCCKTCGRGFTESGNLKKHVRTHSGEKPYCCKTCGRGFTQSSHLKSHTLTHSREKPFQGKTCGRGFTESGNLKRHTLIHGGKKSFECKTCGRGFTCYGNLKRHALIHSGDKPYCCELCGRVFAQSASLKKHTRTHSGEKPYCCKTCGRGFTQSSALKTHNLTHSGEKPYCCETCGRGFTRSSDLKRHNLTHSGEKLYCCKTCGRGFTYSSALKKHTQTPSGEKP